MSTRQKDEFETIVKDILNNEKFKKLDNELHHGITRYSHSLRVAKATYKMAKRLNLDYKVATRAALMHDFYLDEDIKENNMVNIIATHPEMAFKNAKEFYNLNEKYENIIKSHMFPLGKELPKYKESWLVSTMDKTVALYEMYRFKFSLAINVWTIFAFNMITLQK